jgi:hypothetical protein
MVTRFWLDGSGYEIRLGCDFLRPSRLAVTHSASCKMGTGFFTQRLSGRGVALTTHLHLKKKYSYTSTPLYAFVSCHAAKCTFHSYCHGFYLWYLLIPFYSLLQSSRLHSMLQYMNCESLNVTYSVSFFVLITFECRLIASALWF